MWGTARATERLDHGATRIPWVRHEHLERYRFAAQFVRDRSVLDCACGDGTGATMLAAAGADSVLALDIDPDAFTAARDPIVRHGTGDVRDLPLRRESVDVYVSFETIEHVEAAETVVAEAARVIRPGGTFICSTPNRHVYSPGHTTGARPWNPFHVRELDQDEFSGMLTERFMTVDLYGQNPRHRVRPYLIGRLGRLLPCDLAVRARQVAKLPMLLRDSAERHAVTPLTLGRPPEILLAVCQTAH